MRLNVQTDLALRLLMHLAVNKNSLVTISEVADRFQISRNHLMKVAVILGRAGFIESVRGRSGGIRLAMAPHEISVGAVVRRLEGDFALVECFQSGKGECLITPACKLKGAFREALIAFWTVLDKYCIHDLVSRNPDLRELLASEAA